MRRSLQLPLERASGANYLTSRLRKRPQGKFFQVAFELEALKGDFRGFLFCALAHGVRMMDVNETMAPECCWA